MEGLTEEELAIVELVRDFVDSSVKPVVQELEHGNTYPGRAHRHDEARWASSAWPSPSRGARRA